MSFSAAGAYRVDSPWVEQQVNVLMSEIIKEDYPERKYSLYFKNAQGLSAGDKTVTYQHQSAMGTAKIVGASADDYPLVEISRRPTTKTAKILGDGFLYSQEDVEVGRKTSMPLERDLLEVALEAMETKIDEIAWIGDADEELDGLVSHPNVLRLVTSTTFDDSSTGPQILAVLNLAVSTLRLQTNGIEAGNTLILPEDAHQYIASTPYSGGSGTDTMILEIFLKGNRHITAVDSVHWLSGAGTGGSDVFVLFDRRPSKVQLLLNQQPTPMPVSWNAPNYKVLLRAKHSGMKVKKPFSVLVVEGIG